MWASEQLISITNQLKSAKKNWLECASNRLAWSVNVTKFNTVDLLAIVATAIDRAH